MPPKNTIFKGTPFEISFAPFDEPTRFQPLGEVVADSLSILDANEQTETNPIPTTGKCEFSINGAKADGDTLAKLFGYGIDKREDYYTFVIKGNPYIHRPRNLKYPNKKRARRIWKKWRRRYGADYPEQMVLPNCTMTTERRGNDFIYKIEAHKIEAQ